ncbi:hypothetical protein GCM10010967_37850 [Dyadobacter beijingensis]|uniref:Spi protease inhibitor domain-containing protein n=1 Tax=Dyadobacter beijingensis TaxID=365489 RepID=A0ABQ2I8H6_9BACT|nr:Spi family protease inhibitor [Dyadobacter beijingensis]GGN00133.1 hypothetical protein GCM10010967_37850 [Dyadobacter beijingensis]
MKHLKRYALLCALFLCVFACSKDKDVNVGSDQSRLSKDKFLITQSEALALIGKSQRNARTTEAIPKEAEGMKTFADRQGRLIFFVITCKNDLGFLLLSADKRMKPVLAFSESGTFDLGTDNPGIQLWKDLIAENAAGVRQNTEAHINIINEWRQFEAGEGAGFHTTDQPVWTPEASCEYFVTHPIPPNVTVQHLTHNLARWGQWEAYNAHCPAGITVPNCTKSGTFPCGAAILHICSVT